MVIPHNICSDDVVMAIKEAKISPWPSSRNARTYQLFYEGEFYPIKYIISLASKFAGNAELPASAFISTESRVRLEKLGFTILSSKLHNGNQGIINK